MYVMSFHSFQCILLSYEVTHFLLSISNDYVLAYIVRAIPLT